MALTPLTAPPKETLGSGWELMATEAGRSGDGVLNVEIRLLV